MSKHASSLIPILLVLVLAMLAGCGGARHEVQERYILVATNIKVEYWQAAEAGLRRAAAHMKVKAELLGPDTYDPKAQVAAFRDAVSSKPSGVLVSAADPALMKPEIDAAIAQGIPVITMDSDAPDSKRLAFIGTDNYRAGVTGAQVAVKLLQGKGGVVIYSMPEQANLNDRLRGYRDIFETHSDIRILDTIDVHGDPRISFDKTSEIIDKGVLKPDAFVCLEATACSEVAEVLDRKGVKGKVVVAMDSDKRTLEWIQKGVISATIGQKPYTMAYFGVKMLDDLYHHKVAPLDANWAQNSFSPLPTFVDTGATLINRSNLSAFTEGRDTATQGN